MIALVRDRRALICDADGAHSPFRRPDGTYEGRVELDGRQTPAEARRAA